MQGSLLSRSPALRVQLPKRRDLVLGAAVFISIIPFLHYPGLKQLSPFCQVCEDQTRTDVGNLQKRYKAGPHMMTASALSK